MDQEKPQLLVDLKTLEQNVPDRLHPLLDFLLGNLRIIGYGVAGLLVLVAAYGVVSGMRASSLENSREELGLIVVQKTGSERVAALEEYARKAPDGVRPKALLELARAGMDDKQYDKAVEAWKQVEGLGDPELTLTARMGQAKSLMLGGKNKEAVAMLTAMVASVPQPLKRAVNAQLASAAEAAGDIPQAVRAYQELASSAQNDEDRPYLNAKIEQLKARL